MAVAVTVAVAVAVALVMLTRAEWASGAPNYHGCQTEAARRFRYCNVSLSIADRVEALLVEMTLEERVGMIAPDPSLGSSCFAHIHGVPRLELPPYGWLVEMNTGVASECLGPNQCATTFAGPTGLGAAFNRTMWAVKGTVLSTEMRAFSNANWYRAPSTVTSQFEYIGTSAFGPNLNIIRDPRCSFANSWAPNISRPDPSSGLVGTNKLWSAPPSLPPKGMAGTLNCLGKTPFLLASTAQHT